MVWNQNTGYEALLFLGVFLLQVILHNHQTMSKNTMNSNVYSAENLHSPNAAIVVGLCTKYW